MTSVTRNRILIAAIFIFPVAVFVLFWIFGHFILNDSSRELVIWFLGFHC